MNFQELLNYLETAGLNIGLKILGALVALIVGRWIIRFVVRLARKALELQVPEPTLNSYIGTLISVLLHIALIVSILGFFGFETTTFAALAAGVGVAIGAAWSGLLSNFAAGFFLVVLRPFKLGDTITAGGVTGKVKEIGMFFTRIDTADHVVSFVGNNKIFSDNIQNYTQNDCRRIDARLTLAPERNPLEVMRKIEANLAKMPSVLKLPAPEIGVLEVTREGTTVAVRPYAENNNYQQVLFDTNRMIVELLAENKEKNQQEL